MKGYKRKNKKPQTKGYQANNKKPEKIYINGQHYTPIIASTDLPALGTSCTSGLLSARHYYLNNGQELKGVLTLPCIKSTSKCR